MEGCASTSDVDAAEDDRLLMVEEDELCVVTPLTPVNIVEPEDVNREGREIVLADIIIGNTVVLLGRESGFIVGGTTVEVLLARLLLLTVGVMVTVRLLLFFGA